MKVSELYYEIPKDLIAREPREFSQKKRSDSKLLVMERDSGNICHKNFSNIINYLNMGDVLVLNNSKTIKANLVGLYNNMKKIEVDLCGKCENGFWMGYIQFGSFVRVGGIIEFSNGVNELTGIIKGKCDDHVWIIQFYQDNVIELVNKIGRPIISHYFKERFDIKYLQNTYSTEYGSAELPAAGRYFDDELLERIRNKGIKIVYVTLHVGLSSIAVDTESFEDFKKMHEEYIEISQEAADTINFAKSMGNKVIGTGTTVMRTLESCVNEQGLLCPYSGFTNLYIYEGFKFKIVDKFITNFHAPNSTRIALAAAFTGKDLLIKGYKAAKENSYMFFEFGDATLTI